MTNTTINSSSSLAEARFQSARANSLTLAEFVQVVKDTEYTAALTLYYRDGEEYGVKRVHAARKDEDLSEELLFFSFEPIDVDGDTDDTATATIHQSLFLNDTYSKRWFVTDPGLDGN